MKYRLQTMEIPVLCVASVDELVLKAESRALAVRTTYHPVLPLHHHVYAFVAFLLERLMLPGEETLGL